MTVSLTENRSRVVLSISTAVIHTSPSPWTPCASPTENSAPSTSIGKYSVLPAVSCRTSMLPPTRRGGIVLCTPGSASATPITPQNGASGTCTPSSPRAQRPSDVSQIRIYASEKSSGSRPRPGENKVKPQSDGATSRISTTSVCPAVAPVTAIGPVNAWPTPGFGLRCAASALVHVRWTTCPLASQVSIVTVSPGATCSTGARLLSQA